MLEIEPADLTDLNGFPLLWRWTDSRYGVLSADELARIRPLRPDRARDVHRMALALLMPGPDGFRVDAQTFEAVARCDSRGPDVIAWLTQRIGARSPIVVSWDATTAVLTDSELFIARWDECCYPASDDVSILPLDGKWVLHFWHEEQLLHARRRQPG